MPTRKYGSAHWGTVNSAFTGTFVGTNSWGNVVPLGPYTLLKEQDNTVLTGCGASGNGNFWHCHKITDTAIPANSTDGSVVIRGLVSHVNNPSCGYFAKYGSTGTAVQAYYGGAEGAYYHYNSPDETKYWTGSFGWPNNKDAVDGTRPYGSYEVASSPITTDGWGNAISGATFQTTGWGLVAINPGTHFFRTSLFKGAIAWELAVEYTFTLPYPIVATASASGVTNSSVQLNGTINPNSATSTYPVTYGWYWGTNPGYLDNSYLPGTLLTGSTPQDVSYQLTGLAASTGYYFELRAWTVTEPVVQHGSQYSFGTVGNAATLARLAVL